MNLTDMVSYNLSEDSFRVSIVGCGLIGGSIGMALRSKGWYVSAVDLDPAVEQQAVALGAADAAGYDSAADLVVIAGPVRAIPKLVKEALEKTSAVVTDVGSTKSEVCRQVQDDRFIGGHPMAGSELDGLAGSRGNLFVGALWILTPYETTGEAFTLVRKMVKTVGADPIVLSPEVHDQMVAQISHVPHLTASALMNMASSGAVENAMLLRLAAGGFRDMTRISAGLPRLWQDICLANKDAISSSLGSLIETLSDLKGWVEQEDDEALHSYLEKARSARINLPHGFGQAADLREVVIPVKDQPGEIFTVTNLASEMVINIVDLEIMHSAQGNGGVMIVLIDTTDAERYATSLRELGYAPQLRPVGSPAK